MRLYWGCQDRQDRPFSEPGGGDGAVTDGDASLVRGGEASAAVPHGDVSASR